jgi:hypothetical protein
MNPGRELDALVAEKVMGRNGAVEQWRQTANGPDMITATTAAVDGWRPIPNFSSDIAAAWEVLEKLRGMLHEEISVASSYDKKFWVVCLEGTQQLAHAETAAHAICLAALKAVNAL